MEKSNLFFAAYAIINGNDIAPNLMGTAYFYPFMNGTILEIEIVNMPNTMQPYALHIHKGESCDGKDFEKSLGHFNPTNAPHPMHAGDLPPLFSNNGYSYMKVFTNRFTPKEVIRKTIIIHNGIDDFTNQPAGNSGPKMACGVIKESKH